MMEKADMVRSKKLWILAGLIPILACAGFVSIPFIGEWRLGVIERHLAKELAKLPKGTEAKAILEFCKKVELEAAETPADPYAFGNTQPTGAKFVIYARHPYEATFIGMTAYVKIDFWLDQNKRLIKADLTRGGSAL